jgi:Fe-S-cluster containining protein
MGCFECTRYHDKCKAECCGIVPIPASIWQKNQHNIQRPIKEKHKVKAGKDGESAKLCVLPITDDGYCPFLTKDYKCAIYAQRPDICRKFGDESHIMLTCPMQKADGTARTDEEIYQLGAECNNYIGERYGRQT